jgi:hypothetical protein
MSPTFREIVATADEILLVIVEIRWHMAWVGFACGCLIWSKMRTVRLRAVHEIDVFLPGRNPLNGLNNVPQHCEIGGNFFGRVGRSR